MQYRIIDNSTEDNSLVRILKSYILTFKSFKRAIKYFIKGFNFTVGKLSGWVVLK